MATVLREGGSGGEGCSPSDAVTAEGGGRGG